MAKIISGKKSGNLIKFQLNNTLANSIFSVPLVNSMRRTLIADINTFAIDKHNYVFHENTSMFNADEITMRMKLIPLNHKELEKMDIEKIKIVLKIQNDGISKIYYKTKDLAVVYDGSIIDSTKIIPNQEIIIGALKPNQKVDIEYIIMKGNMKKNGAEFMQSTTIGYDFETDEKMLSAQISQLKKNGEINNQDDEKNYRIKLAPRYYSKTNNGQPLKINFQLETNGNITSEDLFKLAIDKLHQRFSNIKLNLKQKNEEKTIIKKAEVNFDAFDFMFIDEDDTFGNLINYYLNSEKEVAFCGYSLPHYLERNVVLRISLAKDNTEKGVSDKISKTIDKVLADIKTLEKSFNTVKF